MMSLKYLIKFRRGKIMVEKAHLLYQTTLCREYRNSAEFLKIFRIFATKS